MTSPILAPGQFIEHIARFASDNRGRITKAHSQRGCDEEWLKTEIMIYLSERNPAAMVEREGRVYENPRFSVDFHVNPAEEDKHKHIIAELKIQRLHDARVQGLNSFKATIEGDLKRLRTLVSASNAEARRMMIAFLFTTDAAPTGGEFWDYLKQFNRIYVRVDGALHSVKADPRMQIDDNVGSFDLCVMWMILDDNDPGFGESLDQPLDMELEYKMSPSSVLARAFAGYDYIEERGGVQFRIQTTAPQPTDNDAPTEFDEANIDVTVTNLASGDFVTYCYRIQHQTCPQLAVS